jgi:DNA-binding GntR family transcriptional regulator
VAELEGKLEDSRHEDPDRAWQGHYDFHEQLVTPAASAWDLRLLHTLWTAAERYTLLVFDPIVVDDAERAHRYSRHRRLFDRAAAGDAAGLEAELAAHLDENERQIVDRVAVIDQHADAAPVTERD